MCSYITQTTDVVGSAYSSVGWIDVRRAVVSFDHPQKVPLEHALCIDFRSENGDPSARVAIELDPRSARTLAESILASLGSEG